MVSDLKEIIESSGFDHYGWARLEKPLTLEYYKTWIAQGKHGDMEYLDRHIPLKEDPKKVFPKAQTAIVFSKNYLEIPNHNFPFQELKIARYARGQDYHIWFQQELDQLCAKLKVKFPEHDFVAFTDSKPVMERDLAYRAGLGWVGKNTCLLNEKRGSLFFIGEIYTSLNVEVKLEVAPDRCGTCTRCIDACPTQALTPKSLDATKCISYWTIEAKSMAPESLRKNFDGWYFGCDICQTVCPWNQKNFSAQLVEKSTNREVLVQEIRQVLTSSDAELKQLFTGTPLERAKPWAHKRNAMIVASHHQLHEVSDCIENLLTDEKLKALADWALLQTRPQSC